MFDCLIHIKWSANNAVGERKTISLSALNSDISVLCPQMASIPDIAEVCKHLYCDIMTEIKKIVRKKFSLEFQTPESSSILEVLETKLSPGWEYSNRQWADCGLLIMSIKCT